MKRKRIFKILSMFSLCLVLILTSSVSDALGATSKRTGTLTKKGYFDKTGHFYMDILGDEAGESNISFKFTRSNYLEYDTAVYNPTSWTVTIGGTNNHNVRFADGSTSKTVTTKLDQDYEYNIFELELRYDMPAHYKYSSMSTQRYESAGAGRINFYKYSRNYEDTTNTAYVNGGHECSKTTRYITISVNTKWCGLRGQGSSDPNFYCGVITLNLINNQQLTISYNTNGGVADATEADGDRWTSIEDGTIYKNGSLFTNRKTITSNSGIWDPTYGLADASIFKLTKTGHSFLGWGRTPTSTTYIDEGDLSLTFERINPDIVNGCCSQVLYAIWKPNSYTASTNHYKYENNTWVSFKSTSQSVTYANTFTPSFVSAPTGYYASHYNTWTSDYKTNLGSSSISMPAGNTITEVYYYPNKYYLDVNGYLDGTSSGSIAGYGTCDVYINGSLVANDVSDFYSQYDYGSTYEIKDIKSTEGHTYNGVESGSIKGTIGVGGTGVRLNFTTNSYTNSIAHWAGGFKNGEGNNGNKTMFKFSDSSFQSKYNNTYNLSNKNVTIPNGFYADSYFGTSSITGSWGSYNKSDSVTQKANSMYYEFYYYPYTYNITYDLDGGENATSNPSTYNVLYGVTLNEPTKDGHAFDGWYYGDKKITGINEGCNATFTSADDFYTQLSKRQTGDITLTAKWHVIASTPTITAKVNYYFNTEDIPVSEVIKNANASDEIDGDISDKITIESFQYPDGSIVNNPTSLKVSQLGVVKVTYKVINSSNIEAKTTNDVIIVSKGTTTTNQNHEGDIPKIYSRYISNDSLADGHNALDSLTGQSIWLTDAYQDILTSSLSRTGDNYIQEFNYINE